MSAMERPTSGTSGEHRTGTQASRVAGPVQVHAGGAGGGGGGGTIGTMAEAMAYLLSRPNLERSQTAPEVRDAYKLDRMRALAAALGNPQESFRSVHVAGTKGKGSTCEMIAAMLEGCGYTVGLYTSPHLQDVRERIRLNRHLISPQDFARLTAMAAKAAGQIEGEHGPATFFELLTVMGFVYFAEQAVDIAVVEVGLGGKLDCTNIITPEVAAVATIGFDHMEILGDTIELIAAQKAGIFKGSVPAVTIDQDARAIEAMRAVAKAAGADFCVVGKDVEFSTRMEHGTGGGGLGGRGGSGGGEGRGPQAFVQVTSQRNDFDFIPVPMAGEHQALNCGLALAVIDKLTERGFVCPIEQVVQGLSTAKLAGRFEVISGSPRIVFDGAHNGESMRALMKTLGQYVQYDSLTVVCGIAADKDIASMLRTLASGADKVIFTRADNKRAADPAVLQKQYRQLDSGVSFVTKSVGEAMELARKSSNLADVICVTGSFYVVGEARAWLAERLRAGRRK